MRGQGWDESLRQPVTRHLSCNESPSAVTAHNKYLTDLYELVYWKDPSVAILDENVYILLVDERLDDVGCQWASTFPYSGWILATNANSELGGRRGDSGERRPSYVYSMSEHSSKSHCNGSVPGWSAYIPAQWLCSVEDPPEAAPGVMMFDLHGIPRYSSRDQVLECGHRHRGSGPVWSANMVMGT